MKAVLIASVLGAMLMPSVALAGELTVSSAGVREEEAYVASDNPVVSAYLEFPSFVGLTPYVLPQVGTNEAATEFETGVFGESQAGIVELVYEASVLAYPAGGSKPIYSAAVDAYVPVGPITLGAGVRRFEGGWQGTNLNVEASTTISSLTLTVGKAWNNPEDLDPWFVRASLPLSKNDQGLTIGVRGFWGAGSKLVVDITRTF